MPDQTLAGVTVVVTRPEGQTRTLLELLEARGALVVAVPLIEIVVLDCADELGAAVAALTKPDWVVVASPNGADVFVSFVRTCVAKVAAVGRATAVQLPRTDLVPERSSAQGLVDAFPRGNGRVLVLQAEGGAGTLVDGLRAKGWSVQRIDTHVARPLVPTGEQRLAMLKADAVVFTSGSQANAWAAVFGTAAPPVIVAIGPQTADDARAVGLAVTVVAADHSVAGVVATLEGQLAR